jgi:hypothetical protein
MAGEDLLGAVELFEQHAPDQQVRPSHRAQRQDRLGAVEDRRGETIGAADREGKFGYTLVAPTCEPVGETTARPRRATFVEGDKVRSGRQSPEDQRGLARLQRRGGQALAHLELDDRDGREDARGV